MRAFVYQYIIMWLIFCWGLAVGFNNGELALSGPKRIRVILLVLGMLAMMALQAIFTDWDM